MTNSQPSSALQSSSGSFTPSGLAARLDAEWSRLRFDRRRRRRVDAWGLPLPPALRGHGVRDLEDVVDATHRRHGASADEIVRALVEHAAHDPLATTILLRRLLPLLLAAVRRYGWTTDAPVEQVLSAACVAIRQYDTAARPNHVVPALASDAAYLAFRRELRQRRTAPVTEVVVDANAIEQALAPYGGSRPVDAHCEERPRGELEHVLSDALSSGVPAADVELLAALGAGTTVHHIADRLQVTDRTIRNHRRAAVERVREAIGVRAAA
jgi:DNA-directed RNA polymerase specialized sigma24 family protein